MNPSLKSINSAFSLEYNGLVNHIFKKIVTHLSFVAVAKLLFQQLFLF